MLKEYALYKGEDLLCMGTIKEISTIQEVKQSTIMFYQTKSYKKRLTNRKELNSKILVRI